MRKMTLINLHVYESERKNPALFFICDRAAGPAQPLQQVPGRRGRRGGEGGDVTPELHGIGKIAFLIGMPLYIPSAAGSHYTCVLFSSASAGSEWGSSVSSQVSTGTHV